MPSATDNAAGPAPRLPAWKRLGLKLKSAPETPTEQVQSPKRKQSPIEIVENVKRAKLESQTPSTTAPIPDTPRLARKKSVSFAPETKIVDGESNKQLFEGWAAQQKEQDPAFEIKSTELTSALRTVEAPPIQEQVDPTLDEKERRVKRIKKEKCAKASKVEKKNSSTTTTASRPFLKYLHQYHDSRDSWKFNKNHQNQLLKHAFEVAIVPSDHSILLYEYVRGLQGGVRTRLRDTALAIKIGDLEASTAGFPASMADKDQKQHEYDMAMKEYIATMMAAHNCSDIGYEEGILAGLSDSAMQTRAARRMRSERILAELAAGGMPLDEPGEVEEAKDGGHFTKEEAVPQKLARKRKQRTVVAEDSSSSDSSDSSSDEEDSSDDSAAATGVNSKPSSDSSSSSSDSDSDSESSSEDGSDSD